MIKIINEEHYENVVNELKKMDSIVMERFQKKLDYLDKYGGNDWVVEIGYDFAKYSFGLTWYRDNKPVMYGGLIYYSNTNDFGIHT